MLDKFLEEFGTVSVAEADGETLDGASPTKRGMSEPTQKSPKKARVQTKTTLLSEVPDTTVLVRIPLTQKGQNGVEMKVLVGNLIFLINETEMEVLLPSGSVVAGFGKGKFQVDVNEAGPKNKLFELKDCQTEVYHNNKVQLLLDVVNDRRKQEPSCKVAYHELTAEETGEPGAFTLNLKHRVHFVPAKLGDDDAKALNQMSVGAALPMDIWDKSEVCLTKWATKWAVNGLTPVRPLVFLGAPVSLGAGRAIQLA